MTIAVTDQVFEMFLLEIDDLVGVQVLENRGVKLGKQRRLGINRGCFFLCDTRSRLRLFWSCQSYMAMKEGTFTLSLPLE